MEKSYKVQQKILCKFDGPNPKMWQLVCTNGSIVERERFIKCCNCLEKVKLFESTLKVC